MSEFSVTVSHDDCPLNTDYDNSVGVFGRTPDEAVENAVISARNMMLESQFGRLVLSNKLNGFSSHLTDKQNWFAVISWNDTVKEKRLQRLGVIQMNITELAKKIAPDYPNIETVDTWEQLYAIDCAYRGTNMANNDLHLLINELRLLIGISKEDVLKFSDLVQRNLALVEVLMETKKELLCIRDADAIWFSPPLMSKIDQVLEK